MVSLSFIYHLRGHAVLQGCIENNKTHIFCYNEASEKDQQKDSTVYQAPSRQRNILEERGKVNEREEKKTDQLLIPSPATVGLCCSLYYIYGAGTCSSWQEYFGVSRLPILTSSHPTWGTSLPQYSSSCIFGFIEAIDNNFQENV